MDIILTHMLVCYKNNNNKFAITLYFLWHGILKNTVKTVAFSGELT